MGTVVRFNRCWLHTSLASFALGAVLAGCAAPDTPILEVMPAQSVLLGRNAHYAVVRVAAGETYESLAEHFLGDRSKAWRVRQDANTSILEPGQILAIELDASNPVGVVRNGYQKVPILSYHHFGTGDGKLSVSANQFRSQLRYLRDNHFTVVPLSHVIDFLAGRRELPARSVVLSIDDGYRSAYEVAYPLLREFGYPATLFVYSDFIGRGGLSWPQLLEMTRSGLISIQPHSESHGNLAALQANETIEAYQTRVQAEVQRPKKLLEKRLSETVHSYAYPFGATNLAVIDDVRRNDYHLGLTVKRGGNPFFANPLVLRRTMIYRDDSIEDFAKTLDVFESAPQS